MSDIQVTLTDLHENLEHLLNQAAHGDDRVVLLQNGEPAAVIIGIAAFKRLEQQSWTAYPAEQFAQALTLANEVRQRIARWQQTHDIVVEDAVETLQRLREERAATSPSV